MRVSRLRSIHGDSLRQAAARCGISHVTFMRLERGEKVEHGTLERIARAYEVSTRYLVTGRDLAVEFREHLRGLTTDQWQPLITSKDNRLREVLRFLESRGEEAYSLAAVADRADVPRKAVAQFMRGGQFSQEQWERLAAAVGQLLRRALPDGWLRAGVVESDDMVGMAASTFSRVGRGMHGNGNAGRR